MGSGYLTAMEESEIGFRTSDGREWDVMEEMLMLDQPCGDGLGSGDRSRGTYRVSPDGSRCSVRMVPVRVMIS